MHIYLSRYVSYIPHSRGIFFGPSWGGLTKPQSHNSHRSRRIPVLQGWVSTEGRNGHQVAHHLRRWWFHDGNGCDGHRASPWIKGRCFGFFLMIWMDLGISTILRQSHLEVSIHGGYPKMDGLSGKIRLKRMIYGYFRKPPFLYGIVIEWWIRMIDHDW